MLNTVPSSPASLTQSAPPWQQQMRDSITDPERLLEMLDLPQDLLPGAQRAAVLFGLRVPQGYVARMRRRDAQDPLLRQVLPLHAETASHPNFRRDAVGDMAARREGGILHKYHGRALLITTGACAVHCRYCFRRHFPYNEVNAARASWRSALAQIAADESLEEIILSGGDPLSLSNTRLQSLIQALDGIPHVQRLRIHTRTAIVLPQRVDTGLLHCLQSSRLQIVVVVHANHAQELDDNVAEALGRLRASGACLLNQSVLLRGVNDDSQVLIDLSKHLFKLGVLPYYLHLLDKVEGAEHFDVPEQDARILWQNMAAGLPGYLVPKLAREQAGGASKILLGHLE